MFLSKYQQSLEYLIKTFNVFLHHAINYLEQFASPLNKSLCDILSLWIHPKGVVNLVKTIALQYKTTVPFPQLFGFEQNLLQTRGPTCPKIQEVNESDFTPEKSQKKQLNTKKGEVFQENYSNQNYEEDSSPIKKEDSYQQSSLYQSQGKLYKRGPYKSYTVAEKLKAVELFLQQRMSITDISKRLGIPCKNIKRWATEGVSRKRGGGRRRTNPGLEQQVYKWLVNQHNFGETISIDEIQEYALSRSRDPNFKASRGWAIKFIQRYNLRSDYAIV